MDGKQEIGDVLFGLKRKWDNIWYHYKFAVIGCAAILLFIIVSVSQCASKTEGDANIAYIGSKELNAEEYEDLHRNFDEIIGGDLNGDGKVYVDFTHFLYMTDAQVRNARADGRIIDMQSLMVVQTQISLELNDTKTIIYFIDPEVYKSLKKSSGGAGDINDGINGVNTFMPLEEALGYSPEKRFDEFSIKLKDLYCWEYYAGIGSFPEETLVAVRDRRSSDADNKATDERYRRNLLMFKRMVEYDKR